ncbi:MAG: type I pullulanase [Bacilli bacterium]|nr:type I pullulanase [Bacilli bacterium]
MSYSKLIKRAYFVEMNKVEFLASEFVDINNLQLLENAVNIPFTAFINGNQGLLELARDLNFANSYQLLATAENESIDISFEGLYDSEEFEAAFAYEGNDLGVLIIDGETHFRIWAPFAKKITLNLYDSGTPLAYGGCDHKESFALKKSEKGTWTYLAPTNLHGKYYTYSVTNASSTDEIIDPYARSAGINGIRGMVVDFTKVNPKGFIYGNRPDIKVNDAIIYELHIRDLTIHSSWNGPDKYRGKYLGLTIEGTTYNQVSTGLDHLKELGITHLQLLPVFDFAMVDESRLDDQNYEKKYNWGYMPLNYNVLEGSYSTNPYDGANRIIEFKTLCKTLSKNNIGLIMDVVYNHTALTADSNFHLLVPGYFHRLKKDGTFADGSGTGNETASERYMVRKFIIDSLVFWAKEYNLSGFRFDLMALHDLKTMNQIVTALKAIDENILIYGEPWTGGYSILDFHQASGKVNLEKIPQVGAFNDDFRDAVKGSVFYETDRGFVQGRYDSFVINRIKYGIVGGVNFPGIDHHKLSYNMFWHLEPDKTINYVSAHDNHTLKDKLTLSTSHEQKDLLLAMHKQAGALVLTSQGISFIHAGMEFLRSKVKDNIYDSNSYASGDEVNQLRWDEKSEQTNLSVFNYYRELIKLRKTHPAFRLRSSFEIREKLSFLYPNVDNILAYLIDNSKGEIQGENKKLILVIHNNGPKKELKLPFSNRSWQLLIKSNLQENSLSINEDYLTIRQSETLIIAAD